MGGSELTAYCLAFAGIVLAAASFIAMVRRSINVDVAHRALAALAEAGDVDRLVTLCGLAPRTHLDAIGIAALAADPKATFDATGARLDGEWRYLADRGLTGTVLCVGGALLAWNVTFVPVWIAALALVCGVYFVLRRGAVAAALDRARAEILPLLGRVPAAPKAEPDTGITRAPPSMLAILTKGKLSFATATARKPSLRDGTCPLCDHATVLTVDRRDTRFKSYICAACGYAQDFADLAKL